jgi:tetratricopeptide (TPR) repeat protein
LAKGDESKAVMVFQKALDVYTKNFGGESALVAKVTDRIAFSYFMKEDYPKSEEYYVKLATLRQKINGPESRETAAAYTNLANVYRKDGKWSLADGAYLEAITINDKALTKEEKAKRTDTENYQCFLYHWGANINSLNAMIVRAGEFDRARAYAERPMSGKPDIPNTGVINGKAIHLEKPEYPVGAMHAPGFCVRAGDDRRRWKRV